MPTALVTGSNRGIGLEIVKQLRGKGFDVIGVCRKASPELERTGAVVLAGIDVGDASAPAAIAKAVGDRTLDLVVHNAGLLVHDHLGELDRDAIEKSFRVNALGPLLVTDAIAPRLARKEDGGAKVVLITSRMGSIGDNGSGGSYAYRMSKAALNMAGKSLAIDLAGRGVAVGIIHPGFVRTGMTGGAGDTLPEGAAANILRVVFDELSPETTGSFWHAKGDRLPW